MGGRIERLGRGSGAGDRGQRRHLYVELDGLRGVAAVAVMLMHLHALFGAGGELLDRHAYLAVDFFMLLSGFVIAHAYEDRLRDPATRGGFLVDRVIRLYPLLILGAAVGFGGAIVVLGEGAISRSFIYLIAGSLPLPLPPMDDAWAAFPLNFPTWSLFWEVVLNAALAFGAPFLSTRRLIGMVALCLMLTLAVGVQHGSIDVGATFPGVIGSAPRMVGEFAGGMVLLRAHRAGWGANGGVRWWVAAVVVACFCLLPKDHDWSLAFDLFAIAVVLPTCILLAAGSEPAIPKVAGWSGSLSYPLYILHVPLSELIGYGFARYGIQPGIVSGAAAVLVVIAAAWVAFVLYDQPLRTLLRRRFGSRRHRSVASTAA